MQNDETNANSVIAGEYLRELKAEVRATSECLAVVPVDKFDWKPHEKSMQLGYLAELTADIPRWVQYAIEKGEVDFATYPQFQGKSNEELTSHFEESVGAAAKALSGMSDDVLTATFRLRHGEKLSWKQPVGEK